MSSTVLVKVLTVEDVEKTLSVPLAWLTKLPMAAKDQEIQVAAIDGVGMFWEFYCAVELRGSYLMPILKPNEWLRFVTCRGLRAGDKIILYSEENKFRETSYVIRAHRFDGVGHWISIA